MNRKLRSRHRIMTTALAVIVPVIFLAGLAVRPSVPRNDTLPGLSPAAAVEYGTRIDVGNRRIGARIDDRSLTVLANGSVPMFADVLIYWHAEPAGDSLPGNAYLIGTLAGPQTRTFALPAGVAADSGFLSFYSLASHELLPTSPTPVRIRDL